MAAPGPGAVFLPVPPIIQGMPAYPAPANPPNNTDIGRAGLWRVTMALNTPNVADLGRVVTYAQQLSNPQLNVQNQLDQIMTQLTNMERSINTVSNRLDNMTDSLDDLLQTANAVCVALLSNDDEVEAQ
ncbi:hypothetical protein D9758_005452 [Tetrapyrgos nigripes]|uniref:Uncharacterized protein n=1 Tax=Tetrapyrgos nigripes TaxID=182062 RepID=A0A8H5GID5_9AGAR|nr:hypothetical protein D9758_005452 [Tetrapyrgos nigripes]